MGEPGKAFIETVDNQGITLEEVHEFLKGKVSRFKYPSSVEVITELRKSSKHLRTLF
jgi:hypothetical protein